ncbi:MAG: tetratricopeptide repeat protein [Candidatus Lokiarchaeota archaeon]|nr:tetratricopeptide repeat protein [Candidatus Lokiarchaeota archaeon]
MTWYRESLAIDEQLGDLSGKATDLNNIGLLLDNKGELDEALRMYREALAIDEQLGDLRGKAVRLNNIGSVLYKKGDLKKALDYFQEALSINERLGASRMVETNKEWIELVEKKLR